MRIRMRAAIRASAAVVAITAMTAMAACGDKADPGAGTGDQNAPANLTMVIASAVSAPKEEVAVFAVATELGYFAEEKLTVKTINADGSVAAVQAVASGSGDISAADAGSILGAVEKGVPVKAVGGLVSTWPWAIATKAGSPISTGADLKGKKIGVISLASGSAPYARAFVKAHGLDPAKDVQLLPVGVGAQASTALTGGQVDALALFTQAYATIENAGTALTYLENPDVFNGVRSLSFAVGSRTLAEKKAVYERFLRAAYKALLFSAKNPEAAMRIGYKVFPQILAGKSATERLSADVRSLNAWLKTAVPGTGTPETFKDWGAISDADWSATQRYTKEAGQIKADQDLAKVWDGSLLAAANSFDPKPVLDKASTYPTP